MNKQLEQLKQQSNEIAGMLNAIQAQLDDTSEAEIAKICTGGSRCGCDECFDERAGKRPAAKRKEYVFVPTPKHNASPAPKQNVQAKRDVNAEHSLTNPIDAFFDKEMAKTKADIRKAAKRDVNAKHSLTIKLEIEQDKIKHQESLDPTQPVITTHRGKRHVDMRHMALPQIRQWAQALNYDNYMKYKNMPFILPNGIKSKDDVLRVMNPPAKRDVNAKHSLTIEKTSITDMFKGMIGMKV